MIVSFVPPLLLALTLVSVFFIRSRSIATKLVCELLLLAVIEGCLLAFGTSALPTGTQLATSPGGAWLRMLAVVWWLIGARVLATMTVLALGHDARSRQARLFSDLVAGAIYLTAALFILNSILDLPIKGLVATSGVIAIVLGLALQNTLADLFAGIAVGLEQPFHIGDRISIGSEVEGVVVEMNWRSIRVQTDGEDVATMPNSVVARSQIVNRSVPTQRRAASAEIPTISTAPSERLMELIRQALMLSPAVLATPAPSIVIKHVGARTTTFAVNYFVATTPGLSSARSQLLRQVRRFFRHAGVLGEDMPREGLLGSLVLFESLSPAQLGELAGHLTSHSLLPGDTLFEQGSIGRSLYVVRAGIFELGGDADGGHVAFGRIGPGEYLGEISMMSGEPRAVSAIALTSGEVLELPRSALEKLLAEDRRLSAAIERSVQRGLALIDRDTAARMCEPLDQTGTVLGRIRDFLRGPRKA
ncbi:mechanosensitive ion channel family protein [Sphingomonas nostoxanthinifaciens]|uniref:mechanosensitive ion channel family protein n=1 Tax=Sphingomonas nostoxanthinifaciens TaxID=2872652 RepID=UPI001CC1DA51|nr:mechanosensitive ion channel family protein [Sphingomonas nostoxanthinifaciens]UAK23382.1 mechanosensitive ion channel [Sphingomonas nostoxanthinifaciens]